MMFVLTLAAVLFLAWTLGRNNLSNLFGSAIGTRMLPFHVCVGTAGVCVLLGALISGEATTHNVSGLGYITQLSDALLISIGAGGMMMLLSLCGVPASLTQTTTGAYIGWNLFYGQTLPIDLITKTFLAWIYTPLIAGFIAFILFRLLRLSLKKYPIRLFRRDSLIRTGLLLIGGFSAYSFGANNIGSLIGPYITLHYFSETALFFTACLGIGVGFLLADKRVIKTISSGMFPLSPTEALIAVLASAQTLFLFSSVELKNILSALSLPSVPLVPVPLTCAVIGAIIGVAVAKGIDGLKLKIVGKVIISWLAAPLGAGVLCYGFLWLCRLGGI